MLKKLPSSSTAAADSMAWPVSSVISVVQVWSALIASAAASIMIVSALELSKVASMPLRVNLVLTSTWC